MKKRLNIFQLNEFGFYFLIGGTATLIDWSIFALLSQILHVHYQIALLTSYSTAGVSHYVANKFITFKCHSKQIGAQFSLFLFVWLTSLLMNMGMMFILVTGMEVNSLLARIVTTASLLIPNYLMHKFITFNKKIFC